MLVAALLAAISTSASVQGSPCRIPQHALVVVVQPANASDNEIAVYDRDSAVRTCLVPLPGGLQSHTAVLPDGRIVVSIAPNDESGRTSDRGHVDVLGPDGRLLDRLAGDANGPEDVFTGVRGHFFVGSGEDVLLNGQNVPNPGALRMYDAHSLKLLRSLDVEPEAFHGEFAISPDGQTLAALLRDQPGNAHVDVFDTATGNRTLRIPLLNMINIFGIGFYGPNLLFREGSQWQVRSIRTGAVIAAPTMVSWFPPVVFQGISYARNEVTGPTVITGGTLSFSATTRITRSELPSGRELPAVVVSGYVAGIFPVDPDPALASAAPGPELRAPRFPSLAEVRASIPADAPGLQFDDAVTGKHFSYRGTYARIDDPSAHTTTIVDCDRGLAMVANDAIGTYRVLRMDETTIDEHGPPEPYISRLRPPASAKLAFEPIDRAHLKSSLATIGYMSRLSFAPFGTQPEIFAEENEFEANVQDVHPSCARRTFDGVALDIEPHLDSIVPTAAEMLRMFPPQIVSVSGRPPDIPSTSLRVHAELTMGQRSQTMVELTHVQKSAVEPERFVPPAAYLQDTTARY